MTDISKITDYLSVSSQIGEAHVDEVRLLKFDLIISMIGQVKPHEIYMLPPFKTIWIRAYDTFFTPVSMKKLLIGVEAALPVIQNKGKVLVFCMQGKRRSIIMSAAILISCGYSHNDAVEMLIKARKVADPRRWYVHSQIRAFEYYWKKTHSVEVAKGTSTP